MLSKALAEGRVKGSPVMLWENLVIGKVTRSLAMLSNELVANSY